jgi:hypothetical protein
MSLQPLIDATLSGYMQGSPGQSPALQAGVDAFTQAQLPVIQNQMQLAGLGQSPAVGQAASMGLSQAMTPLIQSAMGNQLQAAQQAQQNLQVQRQLDQSQTGLDQSAANLAANIYNSQADRQLQAMNLAGQLALGSAANIYAPGTQLQYQGQQQGINNLASAGQLQQDTAQNAADANRNEFLRLQGLSESTSTGMLGGFSPVTSTQTISKAGGK